LSCNLESISSRTEASEGESATVNPATCIPQRMKEVKTSDFRVVTSISAFRSLREACQECKDPHAGPVMSLDIIQTTAKDHKGPGGYWGRARLQNGY